MHTIYLLLGSNLGDRLNYLSMATEQIKQTVGLITKRSSIYETASWGKEDQPKYLNQVLLIKSEKTPYNVLRTIQNIEQEFGRERIVKWGSRTIDIDILFYNQELINDPNLTIPHPLLHKRRFTLTPLNEIAPDLVHPILKISVSELYRQLSDDLHVYKFLTTHYEDKDI